MDDVVAGRSAPESVRAALTSPSMRRTLRQELLGALSPSAALGPCRLVRVKLKPGRKLNAYYAVDVRGPGAGTVAVAVTWLPADAGQAASDESRAAIEDDARRRHLLDPFVRLSSSVPALGMTVQISPLDPEFPSLVRLTDPAYVADLLGRPGPVEVGTVRYRPGQRHVLRYRPRRGGPAVFAKLYRRDNGPMSYRMATAVADLLADRGDGLGAARPDVYLPDDRVLLIEAVDGTPLSRALRNGRPVDALLRRAGSMLRALHEAPAELSADLRTVDARADVKATRRACEHIHHYLPAVGGQIDAIAARVLELLDGPPGEPLTLSHGDYKADHLLVARRRMTLIDFDSCARADPARDIAKMLADLRWWFATRGRVGLEQAQGQFLAGYGGPRPSARLTRARVYEALLLVKMTARRVSSLDPHWADRTSRVVDGVHAALPHLDR